VPTRFDFERAFVDPASGLKHNVRHLLHVLAMRLDRDTFTILPRFQPSFTDLQRDMACDRRTVSRRLDAAERAGWVIRDRPTKHDARAKHARTKYTLRIPESYLEARGIKPESLGAENPWARGKMRPELGAEKPGARGTVPLQSSGHEVSVDGDLDLIIGEIQKRTGRAVGKVTAARVREEILARSAEPVGNTQGYLRTSIRSEPDPGRWLPTPIPPPYREVAARSKEHA